MMEVFLYNSTVCRLCGEENDNGTLLYSCEENTQNLGELINTYLPLKVSDDGQLPRTICPGCTIQLEATVEFFTLIYNGQKVIRELYQREKEYKSNNEISTMTEENVLTDTMVYEITTDGVYQEEHPAALAAAGLDKPKRKRGRPPKKTKANMEKAQAQDTALKQAELPKTEAVETTGKRRRKTPTRYKEAVQGKELERIFKEEGVIDGDEDEENKAEAERKRLPREPEVIGHREDSGELVVVVKGKGRGRPKGRSRQGPQECDICGLQFSCVGRYMSHVASHGPVRYRCRECGATLPTRLQFEQHQARAGHTGRLVLPADADEEFPTHAEVLIEAPKDPLAPDVETPNVCEGLPDLSAEPPEPPQPAQTTEQATSDVNNDVMPDATGDDNALTMNLPNDPEDEEKTKKGKPKLKCNHCDKMFSSKQSKSMHIKATHQGERPYTCGECGAKFAYPRSLSLHAVSHRRGKHAKGYACDLCGKVLNHPSSVVYHKEAEHAGQRYICSKCGKHFKHKQLLARHQLVHSQHRPFTCKTCNASFKTKANLLNHALLHSGVKRFSCEICKHKFAHKTSLTLHMRWHTGQKPYSCGSCGKSFSQKGNLSEHERIHTGEKPYGCTLCGRRFTTSSQHRLHARRHAAERPFACNQCGKRFLSRAAYAAHARREAGARAHRCGWCGRGFAERWALLKHARRHTGERPFRCPHCPRTFADCSNMNKHRKQVHKQISLLAPEPSRGAPVAMVAEPSPEPALDNAGDSDSERVIYVAYDVGSDEPAYHIIDAEQPSRGAPVAMVAEPSPEPALDNAGDSDSERVIYVAYDVGSDEPAYHIIDAEQALQLQEPEEEPEVSQPEPTQHMPVTDEHGNPLHFTMQDGTRLAITSADGHSLQVVTRDGQTIPVEINGYAEPEEVDNPDTIVHQLHLQKSVDGAGHLYALV